MATYTTTVQELKRALGEPEFWFSYDFQDRKILDTAIDLYISRQYHTQEEFSQCIQEAAELMSTFYADVLCKHTRKKLR